MMRVGSPLMSDAHRIVPAARAILFISCAVAACGVGSGGGADAGTADARETGLGETGLDEGHGPARDAGDPDDAGDASPAIQRVPGWSVRKLARAADGANVVLEEALASLNDPRPGEARIRVLSPAGDADHTWVAPPGSALSDFCLHPSREVTAILLAGDRSVSLVRLSPALAPIGTAAVLDARANAFAGDAARVASTGETVVAVVDDASGSIIAYRASVSGGAWGAPTRTLVEPPIALTPFLPTSGSFDTFGAIVSWFRSPLDADEAGNAYVAAWASPSRTRAHVATFHDGLVPFVEDPSAPELEESDVLLTKLDRDGARAWSRVVGTPHEDEPYAISARAGTIAVVGRARRFPGIDNTAWDPFVAVVAPDGALVGSRVLPLDASGIFLTVEGLSRGGWLLGGSDGWSQNPHGLSVVTFGKKLLALLPAIDGVLSRLPLPEGPRHNEIRTVSEEAGRIWFGGHEDGPIMHTGDADRSLIVATGLLGFKAVQAAGLE
jgi:hypothetical protein